MAAFKRAMPTEYHADDPPSLQSVATAVVRATRARASIDSARLEDVASEYRAGGRDFVERRLHLSRAQAYRLIRAARDAGVLGEDE